MKQQVYEVIRQDGTIVKIARFAKTKFLGVQSLVLYLRFLNDVIGVKNRYTHIIFNRRKYILGDL